MSSESATERKASEQYQVKLWTPMFQRFLDSVNAVTAECVLRIDEDGWTVKAVDPANVAMVSVELPSEEFVIASGDASGEIAVGINTDELSTILEQMPTNDDITVAVDTEKNVLGMHSGGFSFNYECLEQSKVRSTDVPDLDLGAAFEVDANNFIQQVEFYRQFADHVVLGYDSTGDVFWMESENLRGGWSGVSGRTEFEPTGVLRSAEAESIYSVSYLHDIVGALSDTGDILVEADEEFPLLLEQFVGGSEMRLKYALAPRLHRSGGDL